MSPNHQCPFTRKISQGHSSLSIQSSQERKSLRTSRKKKRRNFKKPSPRMEIKSRRRERMQFPLDQPKSSPKPDLEKVLRRTATTRPITIKKSSSSPEERPKSRQTDASGQGEEKRKPICWISCKTRDHSNGRGNHAFTQDAGDSVWQVKQQFFNIKIQRGSV